MQTLFCYTCNVRLINILISSVIVVLVTGATGYLASHIIKQLHESGEFKVRGTVRSLEDNSKLDALKALLHDGENPVEFVEADLLKPESWTE